MKAEARLLAAELRPAMSAAAPPQAAQALPASMAATSAAVLPRIAQVRPANMAATSAAALPQTAQARLVKTAATSAAALPQTAQAPPADSTADMTARPARQAGQAPARAAAERPAVRDTNTPVRAHRPAPAAAGDMVLPADQRRKRRRGVTAFAFNPERFSSSRSSWSSSR